MEVNGMRAEIWFSKTSHHHRLYHRLYLNKLHEYTSVKQLSRLMTWSPHVTAAPRSRSLADNPMMHGSSEPL